VNAFVFRPVIAGMWTHRDLVERRFTFADLLVAHEILDVKARNDHDFREWQLSQGER
jgi:hypothetical protein